MQSYDSSQGSERVLRGNPVIEADESTAFGENMKRYLVMIALVGFVLSTTGCTATCKKMFGLDKRCDSGETPPPQQFVAPPQQFSAPPPMVSGPVNFQQAPCPCNTPK